MKVRGGFHYANSVRIVVEQLHACFFVLTNCPFVFRVFVADSLIKGAGQGLFAKVDAEANTVMSFYNGVRITHTEVKSTQIAYHSRAYIKLKTPMTDLTRLSLWLLCYPRPQFGSYYRIFISKF